MADVICALPLEFNGGLVIRISPESRIELCITSQVIFFQVAQKLFEFFFSVIAVIFLLNPNHPAVKKGIDDFIDWRIRDWQVRHPLEKIPNSLDEAVGKKVPE